MVVAGAAAHSHRPTTRVRHKGFKSRKSTKGSLREASKGRSGAVTDFEPGVRRTPHQHVLSKLDRRNQARQRLLNKQREHDEQTKIFQGRHGAPRVVAVVPLCADVDVHQVVGRLNASVDVMMMNEPTTQGTALDVVAHPGTASSLPTRVSIDRFKQKLQYLPVSRDITVCLDAARVADFIVVVLSADEEVDQLGELMLRSMEGQGMSTMYTMVWGLERESAKQKQQTLASLHSYIHHFHPDQDKLYSVGSPQDCSHLVRNLCHATPKGVHWRNDRSWVVVEEVSRDAQGHAVLTGVVRGRSLKADRLLQVGDFGTYQIHQIVDATLPTPGSGKTTTTTTTTTTTETSAGGEAVLDRPTDDQDTLDDLAPENVPSDDGDLDLDDPQNMDEIPQERRGVLLDEHHYFSDDEPEAYTVKKRLPKGTSAYQAAWYLNDEDYYSDGDDDASDMEDVELTIGQGKTNIEKTPALHGGNSSSEEAARPEDGEEGCAGREPTEAGGGPSEYAQSVMMEEDEGVEEELLQQYRAKKRDEAEDDKQFPDEIELHPSVLVRERLAKYRGLKSLRTSRWVEAEDKAYEPAEWNRLLRVPDYQASRNRYVREGLVGGVAAGKRVAIHVRNVPASVDDFYSREKKPLTLFSLLRHEHKQTVVNYLMTLSADFPQSLKAKEEILVQCGPRRFAIRPVFSLPGSTPNNVHKSNRFLHPGQTAVVSFVGPVTWGNLPLSFFKRTTTDYAESAASSSTEMAEGASPSTVGLTLLGTGSTLPASSSRIIAKRVILTGHAFQIHKRVVTVRYMFFNREDVQWYKALPLWTNNGRMGRIREPLGTHGLFKAEFDGRISSQDVVGISLYKRVFPRPAELLQGPLTVATGTIATGTVGDSGDDDAMME